MEVTPNHQASLPNGGNAAPQAPASNYPAWNAPAQGAGAAAAAAAVIAPGSTLTSLLPMGEPSPLFGAGLAARGGRLPAQGKRPAGESAAEAMAESKRLKRLEKNRESARECRRRKKENKERVEAQLASLQGENLNLRLQLKVGDEAEDAENCEILEIKKSLHDLVSRGVDEGQILQTMDLLTERFADYGSAHTSAADFHLAQLSRLLLPTLTTRVCMHAVLQAGGSGDSGRKDARIERGPVDTGVSSAAANRRLKPGHGDGEPAAEGGEVGIDVAVPLSECIASVTSENFSRLPAVQRGAGTGEGQKTGGAGVEDASEVDMWSSLVAVLEATGEQQAVMRNQVGAIAELARDLEGTTQIMERLKLLLADRNQTLDEEMAAIQRILTPTQSAKFVLWVSKNKACVHMLNQLWEKLHGGETSGAT